MVSLIAVLLVSAFTLGCLLDLRSLPGRLLVGRSESRQEEGLRLLILALLWGLLFGAAGCYGAQATEALAPVWIHDLLAELPLQLGLEGSASLSGALLGATAAVALRWSQREREAAV